MSITALLDRTLTLERATFTTDASGGSIRAYATLVPGVACAIAPASATVVSDYARRDMLVNYHVYTNADLDTLVSGGVQLSDRLTDGSEHYLVKAVKKSANAMVSAEVVYQLDCEMRRA